MEAIFKGDVTTGGGQVGLNSLDLPKSPDKTRVVVAMSGGVDSSVTAALLKREGYDVIGVTMQLYDHGAATHRKGACCAGQDIFDAKQAAARLGIPHYVLDYEEKFKESVMDPFADSYVAGETPVPCISCNQRIKFVDLLETALDLGADVMATGHYITSKRLADGQRALYRAVDQERDQSYFLFGMTHAQLEKLRFPLGEMPKSEVRALAHSFGLSVADKPDSQDICFVPSGKYTDVIHHLRPHSILPGDIVDSSGRVLGQHAGLVHYTIGQRKGLGLGAKRSTSDPLYVLHLDAERNRVVVGPREDLAIKRLELRDINWIGHGFAGIDSFAKIPQEGIEIAIRIRSTRPPSWALLRPSPSADVTRAEVDLCVQEGGVAPGQACVFYDSTKTAARVLGGGFIRKAERRVGT